MRGFTPRTATGPATTFLTIRNLTSTPDELLAVSSPIASRVVLTERAGLDRAPTGQAGRRHLSRTHALMVRPVFLGDPGRLMLFPAEISWDDEAPLGPGDRAVVTITFAGELAASFFTAGRRFCVWQGSDIGHGTISREVFTTGSPS
jgi:hypothetical protein